MPSLSVIVKDAVLSVSSFSDVQNYENSGELQEFIVDQNGSVLSVNLKNGVVTALGKEYESNAHHDKLRLIYYKRMVATGNSQFTDTKLEFIAVGWQSTVGGVNTKFGVKFYPDTKKVSVGSDI